MIAMELAEAIEEIEEEDVLRGLDATPGAGMVLPSWVRATFQIQEDFHTLNEGEPLVYHFLD